MTEVITHAGGPVVPTELIVTCDQTTIGGVGTTERPLHVISGGSGVVVDGTSIAGTGATASPLHTVSGGTAVVTDATLTGNGKTATPLHVVPPAAGTVAVATDATMTGNGTTGSPLHVVPPAAGTVAVATDATLTGNGTTGSPLHVVPPAAGTVAVVTDATLTGNGTTGSPLHVVGGAATVVTDGTSIGGNGSGGSPLHTIAGGTAVVPDFITITGDGTTGNPLRALQSPIMVHGAAFSSAPPITFTVSENGYLNTTVGLTKAVCALQLPIGFVLGGIVVKVADAVGTTLNASLFDIPLVSTVVNPAVLIATSPTSTGTGIVQNLSISFPPITVQAGVTYVVAVVTTAFLNPNWSIQSMQAG